VSSGSRELLGIFTHLDALLQAIHRLRDAGYRDSGVFSPLPRHELEEALAMGPSPVRLFTLVGAILGATTGFVLTIATSLHYPLITSGKPIVSIPPFLVIVFELTILFGALATILGMLLNIRLPRLKLQPDYDPRFSGDRFGLWVRCQGDQIDAAQRILHSCRAEEVSEVLLEEKKPRSKRADRGIWWDHHCFFVAVLFAGSCDNAIPSFPFSSHTKHFTQRESLMYISSAHILFFLVYCIDHQTTLIVFILPCFVTLTHGYHSIQHAIILLKILLK